MVKKNEGFTLIELMIVIAIIAIIAAIAIPNLLSARLSANESNAISTLRNLVTSQAQFQSASNVDEDQDGTGEYGSFGELSGLSPLTRNGIGVPTPLNPPILPATFQTIDASGFCTKSGYLFAVYLPDNAANPVGLRDLGGGGPAGAVDPDNCESMWCAYAWPIDLGTTGNRAFFVNQRGEILQSKMGAVQYSGAVPANAPAHSAAYTAVGMNQPVALPPVQGSDGNDWTPLG
jgi:prepilin-type N-terminal cleavage/methylation domain-containing protein